MQNLQSGSPNPGAGSFNQSGQIIIEDVVSQEVGNTELIPKNEFSFRSRAELCRPLKLLRSLAFMSILLSGYQLVYAISSLAYFPTSYNVLSTLFGLFTVLLSFTLAMWSSKALRTEQNTNLLSEGIQASVWEGILRSLFVALMFRAAVALPVIANMVSISHHTPEHLRAYGTTFEEPRYNTIGNVLSNMAIPLPLFELLLCITFIQGARLTFRYITDPSYTMTRMIYIGTVTLMGSALSLIYNTRVSKDYYSVNPMSDMYPSSDLSTFGILGLAIVPLAFIVWLLNVMKWRAPSAALCLALFTLSIGLFATSLSGYNNTHNVYAAYHDTSSLNAWSTKMERTFQTDFEAFAAVPKYLPSHMCQDPILKTVFNSHETVDGRPIECINTACAKLLGQFYAAPFMAMNNSALLAAVSCLVITVGFLYFWHIGWRDVGVRRKGNFKWFAILLGMLLVFSAVMINHNGSYFHQYDSNESLMNNPTDASLNEMTQRPTPREIPQKPLSIDINKLTDRDHTTVRVKEFPKYINKEILTEDNTNRGSKFTTTVIPAFTTTVQKLEGLTTSTDTSLSADASASRILELQGSEISPYQESFNHLLNKDYRFIILSHNPSNRQDIHILAGPWSMNFDHFAANFGEKVDQVGFIQIGEPGRETVYQVIFSPKKTKPAQVLSSFFLPTNTKDLSFFGLSNVRTYAVQRLYQLKLQQMIYGSTESGVVSLVALSQTSGDEKSIDYSDPDAHYSDILHDIAQKNLKWAVFQRDHADPFSIDITTAPWQSNFDDFNSTFAGEEEQVGFIYLEDGHDEKLYIIAFTPHSNAKITQVLHDFFLPSNTQDLKDHNLTNVNTFIARNRRDLNRYAIQGHLLLDQMTSLQTVLAFEDSMYFNAFNALLSKKYRFVLLSHNNQNYQQINLDVAPWDWIFSDLANAIDPYREQVAIIYLGQPGKEKPYMIVFNPAYLNKNAGLVLDGFGLPRDVAQLQAQGFAGLNYYVAQTKADLTTEKIMLYSKTRGVVSLFEMPPSPAILLEQSPYSNVFTALASKKFRFIILKHDTINFSNIKIDAGPWEWFFSDFAGAFNAYREQVGFAYFGAPGNENLYMVVSNPKYLNKNGGQILQGFGLPTTAAELQAQGLPQTPYIYVSRDLSDITLDNVIMQSKKGGSVYV